MAVFWEFFSDELNGNVLILSRQHLDGHPDNEPVVGWFNLKACRGDPACCWRTTLAGAFRSITVSILAMLPEKSGGLGVSAVFATWREGLKRFHRSAVFLTYVFTALRLAGFILIMPVALRLLPSTEIGLWYVFSSIAGLCGMADLSFAPVIGRHASYYSAGVASVPELGLPPRPEGANPYLPGLAGLVGMARSLYLKFASLVAVLMLLGGGGWLLWQHGDAMTQPLSASAFLAYVLASVFTMAGIYWPSLLFGINQVHACQKTQIAGLVLNYAFMLIGLLSGLGVLALVLGQAAFQLYPCWKCQRLFQKQVPLAEVSGSKPIRWRELWPMTWRSGLVTLGSYLALQSPTLLCSQVLGLEATASYALSLKLALVAHSLGLAWLLVKFPEISVLRAQGQMKRACSLVRQRMTLAVLTYAGTAAVAWAAAPPLLRMVGSRTPLLEPGNLALLLAVVGADFVVGMHGAILQTGNRVPHLIPMLLGGLLSVAAAYGLGKCFGLTGIILAPLVAQLPLNYWWTPRQCWRELTNREGGDAKRPALE